MSRLPSLIVVPASALLACALLGACRREADAPQPPAASAPPVGAAPAVAATVGPSRTAVAPAGTPEADDPAARAAEGARTYNCDDGVLVEVVDAQRARATLPDGRVVALQRDPDPARTLYASEALSARIEGDTAELGQDEGGHWACRSY